MKVSIPDVEFALSYLLKTLSQFELSYFAEIHDIKCGACARKVHNIHNL